MMRAKIYEGPVDGHSGMESRWCQRLRDEDEATSRWLTTQLSLREPLSGGGLGAGGAMPSGLTAEKMAAFVASLSFARLVQLGHHIDREWSVRRRGAEPWRARGYRAGLVTYSDKLLLALTYAVAEESYRRRQ